MYNLAEQLIEQYPFEITETGKGRGAFICTTESGEKILKEYKGSAQRAEILFHIMRYIKEHGFLADEILQAKEEAFLAKDLDGGSYVMKTWFAGRECDTKNREDILAAVQKLASLHNLLKGYVNEIPEQMHISEQNLKEEYEKHTRELKKVRNYIRSRKQKNAFEELFMKRYQIFIDQAEEVTEILVHQMEKRDEEEWQQMYGLCHGDYNQHNLIFTREGLVVVNFEAMHYDVQVGDLAHFMRKILEKHNWNTGLGMDMIMAYDQVRKLGKMECEQIYLRLAYPEKFWKIANHYYNTNKAWVSGRNIEKLQKVIAQEEERKQFLRMLFYFVK